MEKDYMCWNMLKSGLHPSFTIYLLTNPFNFSCIKFVVPDFSDKMISLLAGCTELRIESINYRAWQA